MPKFAPAIEPSTPGTIDQTYARWLRLSRGELVDASESGTIRQTGGAYLAEQFVVGSVELSEPIAESLIETFVVTSDGKCTATGTDDSLAIQWMPTVSAMAETVITELENYEVSIEWPAYLTASLTRVDQVRTTPHFDSDLYLPDAGVDVVAIAANCDGPRLALSSIKGVDLRSGLPIQLDQLECDRFQQGAMASQQSAAHRIVVFPQFGQLHSGPILDLEPPAEPQPISDAAPAIRNLLVFRATSLPG